METITKKEINIFEVIDSQMRKLMASLQHKQPFTCTDEFNKNVMLITYGGITVNKLMRFFGNLIFIEVKLML